MALKFEDVHHALPHVTPLEDLLDLNSLSENRAAAMKCLHGLTEGLG